MFYITNNQNHKIMILQISIGSINYKLIRFFNFPFLKKHPAI